MRKKKRVEPTYYRKKVGSYNFEKHKRENRAKRRKINYKRRILIVLLVIVAVVAFLCSPFFNVDKIQIKGNHKFTDAEIIQKGKIEKGHNIFWGSDKSGIKSRLLENPYIGDVNVSMDLPKTLEVKVNERKAKYYYKKGGYILLDKNGICLEIVKDVPKLPQIYGLTLRKSDLGVKLQVDEERNYDKILKLLNKTKKSDLFFKKVKISKGTVYANIYDNLLVKGSFNQVSQAMDNGSLKQVIYKLQQEGVKRGTITIEKENYLSFNPL
ncbi:MAG: FtsQ-type POTRA domain-containing protein [Clostridia bacterium]|nr:FtsQ-type POTRA domain-containing protein [Clostridia bacterium]